MWFMLRLECKLPAALLLSYVCESCIAFDCKDMLKFQHSKINSVVFSTL